MEPAAVTPWDRWARRAPVLALWAVAVLLALGLTWAQMARTQMLREPRVALRLYAEGQAWKPFAYRALVPGVLRLADAAPAGFRSWAVERTRGLASNLVPPAGWPVGWPIPQDPWLLVVLAAVLLASILAYAAATGALVLSVTPGAGALAAAGAGVGSLVVVIPFVAQGWGHAYDFTVLALSAGMLLAIARGNDRAFLLLFALACLDKETAFVFALAWLAARRDALPRRELLGGFAVQLAVFAVVQGGLRLRFAGNAGTALEPRPAEQFAWLFGLSFQDLATLAVVALLVGARWRQQPLVLRRAAVAAVPIALGFLHAGMRGEMRVFYEILPLGVALAARNVATLWAGPAEPSGDDRTGR